MSTAPPRPYRSIDDIARRAQSGKGAVYHHFRDKRDIFTEVYRASQNAIVVKVIDSMANQSGQQEQWERVEAGTRLFLHSYVVDDDARALLGQVMGVLGWDGVRALDEEIALPFLRATLQDFVTKGSLTRGANRCHCRNLFQRLL